MLERLTVHETAKRPRRLRDATSQQSTDFVQQPSFELLVDAARDPLRDVGRRKFDGPHLVRFIE